MYIHEGINVNYRYYFLGRFRREEVVLSIQNNNQRLINSNCIYRKIHKKSKEQTLSKFFYRGICRPEKERAAQALPHKDSPNHNITWRQ